MTGIHDPQCADSETDSGAPDSGGGQAERESWGETAGPAGAGQDEADDGERACRAADDGEKEEHESAQSEDAPQGCELGFRWFGPVARHEGLRTVWVVWVLLRHDVLASLLCASCAN
jgi:hypothetical protein